MSVVVIGVNNRTMPLDLFERLTIPREGLDKALADLCGRRHVSEAVVLSTCNRTEIYVHAEKFHGAYQDVRDFIAEAAAMAPEDFADHVYTMSDEQAVGHLFAVTAGLDSAVVGENEIQGQVKVAWEVARSEGAAAATLNSIFRQALEVGKRVRSQTGLSRNIASVAHAAVAMASGHLGGLRGRCVIVLGAGDMGEGMARMLANAGLGQIVFANRSVERASRLASRFDGGKAITVDQLPPWLDQADVLLTSTGAQSLMVEQAELIEVMARRQGRPLLIVDIAMPRDVDPEVAGIDGITLLDMTDLRAFADAEGRERQVELEAAQGLVALQLERFIESQVARGVAPLVGEFRRNAEAIRQSEFQRFAARLARLDAEQLETVEALTQGILGKLLHEPSVRLGATAGTPQGDRLAEALRDLFDL
ncbi:MAG: glutamyl-tRNA reductase [Acidimicrobiales bacterium]